MSRETGNDLSSKIGNKKRGARLPKKGSGKIRLKLLKPKKIKMIKLVKYFTYRQAIGTSKVRLEGEAAYALACALANLAGARLSNHEAWIVSCHGVQTAYVWTDGKLLIDCPRLLAGDCNPEHPTLTVLWEKPVA